MKLPIFTILFLGMTSFLFAQNPCQSNLAELQLIGTYNGHNYYLSEFEMTPANAQANATTFGGYLAVINDDAENNFIQQNISEMAYIGLNDVATEGTLTWDDGNAVSYTNFDICNFCNANSAEMDYVMMHPWNGGWSWSSQWNSRKYIVEIPCSASTDIGLTMTTSTTSVVDEEQFVVTLTVKNLGSSTATGLWIKYYDFPEIDQSADEINEVVSQGQITDFYYNGKDWYVGELESGEIAELTLTYEAKVGVIENFTATASLHAIDQVDFNSNNDFTEVLVGMNESTDVGLTMTRSKNSVAEGEQFVITLTVENLGSMRASEIWIKYHDFPVIDQTTIEINETITHGSISDFWYNGKDWFISELQIGETAQLILIYETKVGVTENYFGANASLVEIDQVETNSNNDFAATEVAIVTSSCGNDIDGFITIGEYGNSTYYLSEENATSATAAQTIAESYGGNLVSISSEEENDFIFQEISEMTYIGLNDRQNEGTLEWYDSSPVNYTNFNFCSFCNENSYDYNNVVMHQWDGTWSWSNTSNPRKYVMEIPCASTTESDLALTMNASATEVAVGDPFDATLTVTNNGPEIATNIFIRVWRSDYAQIVTGTPSVGTFEYDYYLIYRWDIPALDVGETAELILNCEAEASPFSMYSLGGSVFEMDQDDPNSTNDNASVGLSKIQMGGCPSSIPGFEVLGEYNNCKYYISNDVSRPVDAQAVAESYGGWLATPTSQAENDFIQQNIFEVAYIGLSDLDEEGIYTWASGETVNYTNFDICDFCYENEEIMDFVMIHPWNGGWSWSNYGHLRRYIIEIPCGSTITDNTPNTLIAMSNSSSEKMEVKRLFPNPANEIIYIAARGEEDKTIQLQIVDIYGKVVQNKQIALHKGENTIEINISNLPAGMFFIRIPEMVGEVSGLKFMKVMD